ncbi:PREDICTED: triggering receptor expressed on myeloid cells 2-like [Acanthisitta chloris]|uniref:triggering receptor expressed on myeloid cells 2-like n=1 Tax=Acanthisitta chloris TaxID=57068 RepID=UPI0004F0F83D|nr:PREDICTED: triggering receptor expressed on myeloid cells 2-like [Acanthisitta chloris]KFP70638.1 Triggering receptor expressed on myeloid cells 2 [Acanthisitta chloris]
MEKLVNLILLFLSASCAAENVTVVYGMEGGTISVNCSYNLWKQRWKEKSWCRQVAKTKCQHVVSTRPFWLPFLRNRNGTTSIRDNIHDGILTVTMSRLRKEDSGLYQCRTDFLGETNSLRKVQVEVLTAVLETQVPEEPRAVQSISRTPAGADLTLFYILAGFLGAKFVVAVLICVIGSSRKSRGREQEPRLTEQQVLPVPAALGHSGISSCRESSA